MTLTIWTTNDKFSFYGEDAKEIYDEIQNASACGCEWTTPIRLGTKDEITFILKHITCIRMNMK